MFGPCRGCEALKMENERLHKLVDRLVEKVAPEIEQEKDPERSEPHTIIKDDEGNIVEERMTFGGP